MRTNAWSHVSGLRIRNLVIDAATREMRPAFLTDDVNGFDLDGLRGAEGIGGQPMVKLIQTQRAWLRNCEVLAGTQTFLEVAGEKTRDIVVSSCNLRSAKDPVKTTQSAPDGIVLLSGNVA